MNYYESCLRAHSWLQHWPHRGSSYTLIEHIVTNRYKSISTRIFNPEELGVFCPILTMMYSLNLIGLSGLRVTRDDLGQIGYIITIYERF